MGLAEDLRVGRVRDLAVEREDLAARSAQGRERIAIGLAGRDLAAHLVARQLELPAREAMRHAMGLGSERRDDEVTLSAQLGDGLLWVWQRLAVPTVLVGHLAHAIALDRPCDDDRRPAAHRAGLGVGSVDRLWVVPVDLDCAPAEDLGP